MYVVARFGSNLAGGGHGQEWGACYRLGGVRKALVGLYAVGKALKEVRTKKSLGPSAEKVVKGLIKKRALKMVLASSQKGGLGYQEFYGPI